MDVRSALEDVYPPCTEIMTGSPFPRPTAQQPFEARVRLEDRISIVRPDDPTHYIQITAPVCKDNNRRYAGSDIRAGQVVLEKDQVVQASHIMALASLGISRICVKRKPRVALWSTGSELVPCDAIGSHHGRIRNSNGPFVAASLRSWGAEVSEMGILQDNVTDTIRSLRTALLTD